MIAPEEDIRIITVDVGNMLTRLGVFELADGNAPALSGSCELTSKPTLTADEALVELRHARSLLSAGDVAGAVLSCVVPALTDPWRRALERELRCHVLVVGPGLRSGIRLKFDNPAEVGGDRIADAIAARERHGAPVLVVDLGTTTNLELVDAAGAFAGGVIAPGIALGARALSNAAARLPVIEPAPPARVLGRNTAEAMRSGVVLGSAAMVDGLVDAIIAEQGLDSNLPIIVTGSNAGVLAHLMRHDAIVDDELTLHGLALIWVANRR